MPTLFRALLLSAALLLAPGGLWAQAQERSLTSTNRRAVASYREALAAYQKYENARAEELLRDALRHDSRFIEAHIMRSQVLQGMGRHPEAIEAGERALAIDPHFFPLLRLHLGNMLLGQGAYAPAQAHFDSLRASRLALHPHISALVELRRRSCEFAIHALSNPAPFEPQAMGPQVNSPLDEYWPSLSADENTLVFTVNLPRDPHDPSVFRNRQEDFFITTRNGQGEWAMRQNIGPPINTVLHNEGAQSLTADGGRMYYTVCQMVCDLYASDRQPDGRWGRPQRLPHPINLERFSEKQPSISPDGQTLYFVSNRVGSFGEFDVWYVTRTGEHSWGEPVNLGPTINTPHNEQSPFIHFDNQTLYFSSDGHVGMGGLDIFLTRRDAHGAWGEPKNLGYPINTHRDEDGLIVNAQGTTAYYSSDMTHGMGRDIFTFPLHPGARPEPASYIQGIISDASNGWPLVANLQLVDLATGQPLMSTTSSRDGAYLMTIPSNRRYAFNASRPGYLFHSSHFDLVGVHTAAAPFRKDIELDPIRVGSVMVMRNIFFETASYQLQGESKVELLWLVDMLALNPTMRIEVGGHTDDVGSERDNLDLSNSRAQAVAQFIAAQGIAQDRITWRGYGEARPVAPNTTEEGRAQNRRTEIRVLGM